MERYVAKQDPTLPAASLQEILQSLKTITIDASKPAPAYVHIFCDKLSLASVDPEVYKPISWLRIFARSIRTTSQLDAGEKIVVALS